MLNARQWSLADAESSVEAMNESMNTANVWVDPDGGKIVIHQESRLLTTCLAAFTTMSHFRRCLIQAYLPFEMPVFNEKAFVARIDVISCLSAPCSSAGDA
jgi:hypothetical protein